MTTTEHTVDTGAAVMAKATPSVSVSIATLAGYNVNELLIWATLIYTVLLIGHKLYAICIDIIDRKARAGHIDRRDGKPDKRNIKLERRNGE